MSISLCCNSVFSDFEWTSKPQVYLKIWYLQRNVSMQLSESQSNHEVPKYSHPFMSTGDNTNDTKQFDIISIAKVMSPRWISKHLRLKRTQTYIEKKKCHWGGGGDTATQNVPDWNRHPSPNLVLGLCTSLGRMWDTTQLGQPVLALWQPINVPYGWKRNQKVPVVKARTHR